MGKALLCLLPVSANYAKMLSQNDFAEPNWDGLTVLHPIVICGLTYGAQVELL
jgi:hypothetical protein